MLHLLQPNPNHSLILPTVREKLGMKTKLRVTNITAVVLPRWSSGHPRILLALILEFDSLRGEILNSSVKKKQEKGQLLRAPSSAGRHNSTRVDDGRKRIILLAI